MRTMLTRLTVRLFLAPGLLLLTVAGVEAQEDKWSFVFTPQVWFENVRNNGFAAASTAGGGLGKVNSNFGPLPVFAEFPSSALSSTGADPTSTFFPQWGGQFAAQYGRWTFAAAAQYISFETRNTFSFTDKTLPIIFIDFPNAGVFQVPVAPQFVGTKAYTEIINTDRVDTDLTAAYFFPDVIKDIMDVTTGLGFKWIRASGHRSISDANSSFNVAPLNYILHRNGCQGSIVTAFQQSGTCLRNRASFLDQYYGATIPTTLNFHLTRDGNWLLPLTVTPFLGSEGRSDEVTGWQTSFAYGGTFDVGVRYIFENGVAAYAGWRGQAIQGNNLFFAQGPLVNLTVRFGGK